MPSDREAAIQAAREAVAKRYRDDGHHNAAELVEMGRRDHDNELKAAIAVALAALAAVRPLILKGAAAERESREHWPAFCDCDPFLGCEDFGDRMEAAGLIFLRPVTKADLDHPFAYEKGIEPGGAVWDLTEAGRLALAQETDR